MTLSATYKGDVVKAYEAMFTGDTSVAVRRLASAAHAAATLALEHTVGEVNADLTAAICTWERRAERCLELAELIEKIDRYGAYVPEMRGPLERVR